MVIRGKPGRHGFLLGGLLSAADDSPVGGDGARTTARVAGDDEGTSGQGVAALRGRNGGGCDHEPQGTKPWSGYREAAVSGSCPTAAGSGAAPPRKRAGGREGGRARLGRGLSILGLPPRPSTTAGIRSRRWSWR